MILTGKAKQDFKQWYENREGKTITPKELELMSELVIQNAFIIEWFDSVGIYIAIKKSVDIFWLYNIKINSTGVYISALELMQKTRQQATEQAIIKANNIYNETKA